MLQALLLMIDHSIIWQGCLINYRNDTNQYSIVEALVEHGAAVNFVNSSGKTRCIIY